MVTDFDGLFVDIEFRERKKLILNQFRPYIISRLAKPKTA
jgi:hypothetical protein